MTFQDFQNRVKKKTSFDKYWYYAICIAIIILSLAFFYFIITRPDKFSGLIVFYYSAAAILFSLGAFGLYLLPNRYKVIEITSNLTIERKQSVVDKLLEDYGALKRTTNQQYFFFTIRKRFWNSPYEVHLFFDRNRFAFSVQGHDYTDGGFIDFGGTEKKRREIIKKIYEFSKEEMADPNIGLASLD